MCRIYFKFDEVRRFLACQWQYLTSSDTAFEDSHNIRNLRCDLSKERTDLLILTADRDGINILIDPETDIDPQKIGLGVVLLRGDPCLMTYNFAGSPVLRAVKGFLSDGVDRVVVDMDELRVVATSGRGLLVIKLTEDIVSYDNLRLAS